MTQNRFVYLISRELSGDASPEEELELQNMLKEDVLLLKKYGAFQKMRMQQAKDKQPDVEQALEKVWMQIAQDSSNNADKKGAEKKRNNLRFMRLTGIAATVILLVGVGLFYVMMKKKQAPAGISDITLFEKSFNPIEKQNVKGTKSSIVLSDGSKIWLNADSKLEYPGVFEGKTREVYLSGEAFFEVAKNPARPFIIHLDNGTVRVLGTSFNIKAYKGSEVVETSVSTGRVAFIPKKKKAHNTNDTTFLTHNIKAVYSVETGEIRTLATVSSDDKAWTEGKLIFKALTFKDIATELERTFGKKIVFEDEDIKQYRLTGSFGNNSLDEILYYLSLSKPFAYHISDEEIVINKVASSR
ncbi:DUF4974 domain-containing protein [Ilyomonas limi]|uniref:DUF4974 domain-containing protein n=1 Tax=Ilyomonas limi TaxID=2575867 RepID=A0A4U3LB41_9BACT|nr:FecR domain-containing protein [Ilyomonas limi]TKK71027.1 DUF4974 domain-containing protein [Ilyomonas limi]